MDKKIIIIGILIILLAVFAAGCIIWPVPPPPPPPPPVPALTGISVHSVSIFVGETHIFRKSPIPSGARMGTVNVRTWGVANTTVGTITSAGVFTAREVGTTNIIATYGNRTGTATATVIALPPLFIRVPPNNTPIGELRMISGNATIHNPNNFTVNVTLSLYVDGSEFARGINHPMTAFNNTSINISTSFTASRSGIHVAKMRISSSTPTFNQSENRTFIIGIPKVN